MAAVLKGSEREYLIDAASMNVQAGVEEVTGFGLDDVLCQIRATPSDLRLSRGLFKAILVDPANPSDPELDAIIEDVGGVGVVLGAMLDWGRDDGR